MDITKTYVKILNESLTHYGLLYKEGLVIDPKPFEHEFDRIGGMHFTTMEEMPSFLRYGTKIADINLLKDSRVVGDDKHMKADKFMLSNIRDISSLDCWSDKKYCIAAIEKSSACLQYVVDKKDVCLTAVKKNGSMIQYVTNPTTEACLAAVRAHGMAIRYITNPSVEVCLAAVQTDGFALQYIEVQTKEICDAAVNQIAAASKFIKG